MTISEILDTIDEACGKWDGDELTLMQALVDKADTWKARLHELELEGDEG